MGLYWLSRDDFRAYTFGGKCGHTLNHRCPIVIHAHFIFSLTISSYLLKTKRINKQTNMKSRLKSTIYFPFTAFAIHLFYKLKPLSRFQTNYKVKGSFHCMS